MAPVYAPQRSSALLDGVIDLLDGVLDLLGGIIDQLDEPPG